MLNVVCIQKLSKDAKLRKQQANKKVEDSDENDDEDDDDDDDDNNSDVEDEEDDAGIEMESDDTDEIDDDANGQRRHGKKLVTKKTVVTLKMVQHWAKRLRVSIDKCQP